MVRIFLVIFSLHVISWCRAEKIFDSDPPVIECSISFPGAATNGINTIFIPFTLVGRLMVVEAKVDSTVGNFIVDTGSERLLLNTKHLPAKPWERLVAAAGNTGPVSAKERTIDKLHLDRLSIYQLKAHMVDLSHIEIKKNTRILGVLGYDVFREFELFIDYQNSLVVLSRVNRNGVRLDTIAYLEHPLDSISFSLQRHLIVVVPEVNRQKLEMILDSGAELNLIDRRTNRKVLEKFTVIKRVNLIGAGKKKIEVLAGTLDDVKCGNQYCKSMNTLLTSLDEINTSLGVNVDGVLGYEFLHQRRTLINYQKRKLYFFGPSRS